MAVGNKKNMVEINSDYVLNHCHNWCASHKKTMAVLGTELGHSECYIQSSCRAGRMPKTELMLLCFMTGLDKDRATDINKNEPKADMSIDEKLDYIIEMLEDLKSDKEAV